LATAIAAMIAIAIKAIAIVISAIICCLGVFSDIH
jgi:hypothetical protein